MGKKENDGLEMEEWFRFSIRVDAPIAQMQDCVEFAKKMKIPGDNNIFGEFQFYSRPLQTKGEKG